MYIYEIYIFYRRIQCYSKIWWIILYIYQFLEQNNFKISIILLISYFKSFFFFFLHFYKFLSIFSPSIFCVKISTGISREILYIYIYTNKCSHAMHMNQIRYIKSRRFKDYIQIVSNFALLFLRICFLSITMSW